MNKTIALVVLIVAVLLGFGVRQYGNSRVAAQELSNTQEAISEAVQARAKAGKVDAQQAKTNAAKRESVRLVLKEKQDALPEVVDCVGDVERIRLLNDAIREVNRIITAPGELPAAL